MQLVKQTENEVMERVECSEKRILCDMDVAITNIEMCVSTIAAIDSAMVEGATEVRSSALSIPFMALDDAVTKLDEYFKALIKIKRG